MFRSRGIGRRKSEEILFLSTVVVAVAVTPAIGSRSHFVRVAS